ncbi:T9SS type A sorting domain-containing protein [Taibaiella koreensis]|uniref:T9SS type A sorting domain-containing protein n=1 Tax=Taibaiella koreensis TaxID=1268548 RepID=UPI000E59BD45|nr:T9SS type A sorting domain-containing protein [Taibaiella koreensis]
MKKILLSVLLLPLCLTAPAQVTYYVDAARPDNAGAGTSWATAKRDLQVAINGAASGDQVWIKAGTYLPTHDHLASTTPANSRDKTFSLKNGVKVYGGFAGTETQLSQRNWQTNSTILSGDIGTVNVATDNVYHVVISVNLTAATVLDGVTVTKGYAKAANLSSITVGARTLNRYFGGGIFNSYASTTFANCRITANTADCDNSNDAQGAGVINDNCSSAFTNCVFDANTFPDGGSSFGAKGAGMYIMSGACTLTNCAFVNNTCGTTIGSDGGAIYMNTGTTRIVNSIFYNNSAMNGAALSLGGAPHTPVVTNCTFANNTSFYAGTAYSGFSNGTFSNCIFWNNTPTVNPVAGRNEIYSSETNVANQPTFKNCIVRDGTGNPLSVASTIMSNCINSNPAFANLTDGDGPDNVFMTADDGLRLLCTSPAIGAGITTTPPVTTDILNLTRIGTPDIGAYEGIQASAPFNSIPTANTTIQLGQNATGTTNYSDCSNELLKIQSGGTYTLGGIVTTKVWIETGQPSRYVKRHYEITPQTNAAAATARVTLYFKQQEFTDFNAVNAVQLPTGPSDATGIANIKIEKKAGSSNNGSGLPDSYTGASQTLSGAALAVSWNTAAARWEISFDVTGFSGFFLKTQSAVLPLRLLTFTGKQDLACNVLQWRTANEVNTREFEIQKSIDARQFYPIGATPAAGSGNSFYEYRDCPASSGKAYYRLKMIDQDGQFTYSTVVTIDGKQDISAELYPNPANGYLLIAANDASLIGSEVKVTDPTGRLLMRATLNTLPYRLSLEQLPAGLYYLQLASGKTLRFVKQR